MRLEAMFLANGAEVHGGLVYVMGGWWDNIVAPALPAPIVGSLVVRVLVEDHPTGVSHHTFRVQIVHESGGPEQVILGELTSQQTPAAWAPAILIALPLTGVPVLQYGFHEVRFEIDGQPLGSTRFRVVQPPSAG